MRALVGLLFLLCGCHASFEIDVRMAEAEDAGEATGAAADEDAGEAVEVAPAPARVQGRSELSPTSAEDVVEAVAEDSGDAGVLAPDAGMVEAEVDAVPAIPEEEMPPRRPCVGADCEPTGPPVLATEPPPGYVRPCYADCDE